MSAEVILLVALVVLIVHNLGIQAYIHFNAYPLLAHVGKADFAGYLGEYEKRLTIPLMLPYGLTMLGCLAFLVLRPASISVIAAIALLLVNAAVAVTSLQVATPIYNRIKAAGNAQGADMTQLMGVNLIRLLLSVAAVVIVVAMLLTVLAA